MNGIIIAGGLGTRLRPLTYRRPKHLLPVANRPFLEYQVAMLKRHGIDRVVFATNYFAEMIEGHFGNGAGFGVSMRYAVERELLGTAGAIRNAASLTDGGPVVVLNGDVLTDFDLSALIAFHRSADALATIAVRPARRPHAYGALTADSKGRVTSWHEPSEAEKRRVSEHRGPLEDASDFINAGIYVLEPSFVRSIPTGRPVSIERETYPDMVERHEPVYAVELPGYWMDIGRPEQLLAATRAVLSGEVHTDVPCVPIDPSASVAEGADVDAFTAVGPKASVGTGSCLRGCIMLAGASVGSQCSLVDLIADEGVRIEDNVTSAPGVVLAEGSVIRPGSRL
ncbi:MAG TPA: NDP-sugar synthase [Chthonomonadales bacterium]|nr:NDP-sugar synthase [Chthonomonadales bacterium]